MSSDTDWQKALKSGQSGDCLEMRRRQDRIEVRDSKNPQGSVLGMSTQALAAWLSAAHCGELDNLT